MLVYLLLTILVVRIEVFIMKLTVQQGIILLIAFLLSGCGLFENEQECVFPNYGVEEGYEWVSPRYDSSLTEPEIFPLWRDRNHLNIRFYNWVGRERADEILEDHGLINRFPQNFYDSLEAGNFVRVTRHPAEHYYTTYGDTTQPSLGNIKEVEYALPAFYSSESESMPSVMVPQIRINFKQNVPIDVQHRWVDSVEATDSVYEFQLIEDVFPLPPEYFLKITKNSTNDPYSLSISYLSSNLIWSSRVERGFFVNGLPPLECK